MESALWKTESYREFLGQALESKEGRKRNLAAFSRKAGFRSRGFIVDLLHGRKRLTGKSLPKVTVALGLKGHLKNYFETLVSLEEEDLRKKGESSEVLSLRLQELRRLLASGGIKPSTKPTESLHSVFVNHHIFAIYASLGSLEKGASLKEIHERTGLSTEVIISQLDILQQHGCVSCREGRFRASDLYLMAEKLGVSAAFREAYRRSSQEMVQQFEEKKNSNEALFYHAAFSVSKSRLPEIKEKLAVLINEFIEKEQLEDGDKVQKITLGFY